MEWVLAAATVLGTLFAGVQVWQAYRGSTSGKEPAAAPSLVASLNDGADWAMAQREGTPASYEEYLANRPDGFFAEQARLKFAELTTGREKVVRVEITGDEYRQVVQSEPQWLKGGEEFVDDVDLHSVGPTLVVVSPGSFEMGSPTSDADAEDNERPAHKVTLPRAFAVGKFPVTFDDWELFHVATGGKKMIDDEGWGAGDRPIIKVTWDRAKQYADWLAETTEMPYRLLSEAEWEYCCRAGTKTRFSTGESISRGQATFNAEQTSPAGHFPPNSFGLHDMHGNVWEWCEDFWHPDYQGAPTDGTAWLVGGERSRVMRGGSWANDDAHGLRSASRNFGNPTTERQNGVGFRIARDLLPTE